MSNSVMNPETTPYDVETDVNLPALSLWTRVIAGFVGVLVLLGSAMTLGFFLFALLVITAGRKQPSPLEISALLQSQQQRIILTTGGTLTLGLSILLASYVVSRILRSQRLVADVTFRRQELQAIVGQMQSAVRDRKQKATQQETAE